MHHFSHGLPWVMASPCTHFWPQLQAGAACSCVLPAARLSTISPSLSLWNAHLAACGFSSEQAVWGTMNQPSLHSFLREVKSERAYSFLTWPGLLSLQPDQPPSHLTQAMAAAVGMQGAGSEGDVLQALLLPQLEALMCSQVAACEGVAAHVVAALQRFEAEQQQLALRPQAILTLEAFFAHAARCRQLCILVRSPMHSVPYRA